MMNLFGIGFRRNFVFLCVWFGCCASVFGMSGGKGTERNLPEQEGLAYQSSSYSVWGMAQQKYLSCRDTLNELKGKLPGDLFSADPTTVAAAEKKLKPEETIDYEFYKKQKKQFDKIRLGGSIGDIFWNNVMFRASESFGGVINERVQATANRLVVPFWDATLDVLARFFRKLNSRLFHGSKDPFTRRELDRWREDVALSIKGFAQLIKGCEGFGTRGNDKNSRIFDSEDQAAHNQDQFINEQLLQLYAAHFAFYAQQIEMRKGYYDDASEVAFLADQLCGFLINFSRIILSVKSIKEVAAKFGQNTSMVSETNYKVSKMFEMLSEAAIPSWADENTKKSTLSSQRQQRDSDYGTTAFGSNMDI